MATSNTPSKATEPPVVAVIELAFVLMGAPAISPIVPVAAVSTRLVANIVPAD